MLSSRPETLLFTKVAVVLRQIIVWARLGEGEENGGRFIQTMKRLDTLFEELFVKLGLSASEGKRKAREIFDVPVIKTGHQYDCVKHLEATIGMNLASELLMVYRQHSVWLSPRIC